MTASEGPLNQNTLLDLSHESLIRQWDRLADWVSEEAKSAEEYQRLRDWAQRWEQGNAELLRGADLANAVAWRQRAAPNEAWAERYGGRDQFPPAMKFLYAGEEAQRAAAAAEKATRRQQLVAKRLALGFAAATVALLAGVVGYHWAYVWDHVAYYKSYATVWGVPKGIEPLTAAERGHRNSSYKITTQGVLGPVQSMERVNSAGHLGNGLFAITASPEENADTPFRWEYAYDPWGRIAYEVNLDRHRQRISATLYGLADSGSTSSRAAYVIKRNGSLAPEKGSCAAHVGYDYSPEGYVTQIHYYDYDNKPTPGKDGAFIKETKYDNFGRIIQSTSLWQDGKPMNDMDGSATERDSYDTKGNLVNMEFLDAAGNPSKNGFFRLTKSYDDRGNTAEVYWQTANGEPKPLFGSCKTVKYRNDEHGNQAGGYCLRQESKPSKSSFAIFKNKFYKEDQLIESTFFDGDEHPILGPDGAFRETLSYDADGNITEFAAYGTDDKPVINIMGFHKQVSKFKNGHEIRTEYRDVDGKLTVLGKAGFVADNKEYDAQGNETRITYLGVDDKPVFNRTGGYAIKTVSYDSCGRATESRFFDADEHPVRSKKGYAVIRQAYDESNNVKEEAYFDDQNQPASSIDGYTRMRRKFDRNRNVSDEKYLQGESKSFLVKGAYEEHTSQYNDHGDLIEEEYLGLAGEPVANELGWAKHKMRYDEHNLLIEEAWFGPDDKPVMLKEGYALRKQHYNDVGQVIEEAYFGTGGEPVVSEDGYSRITKAYDALGRLVLRCNQMIQPILARPGSIGAVSSQGSESFV